MKVVAVYFMVFTFNTQVYFTLRAGGQTKQTMMMDSLFMWSVLIPVVFYLSYYTDLPVLWVYVLGQGTDLLKAFLSYHLLRKEKWVVNLTE